MAAAKLMGQGIIGIREDDVAFSAAKLFFSTAWATPWCFRCQWRDGVLLPHRPTPDAVFDVMRRHRPTIFYGVPTLYASLLAHKDMGRGAGPTGCGSASRRARRCRRLSRALARGRGL